MSNSFYVNWADVLALLGSFGVVGLILVLIAYLQLRWRHRVDRTRRAVEATVRSTLPRDPQREMKGEDRVREFLENADFSNEGNPNFGWKDRFLERSF